MKPSFLVCTQFPDHKLWSLVFGMYSNFQWPVLELSFGIIYPIFQIISSQLFCMQPNFKSLIACSIFPFPSYQHHSSFYTQEHPVKKCSILAPHDVPQFGDNVEMNLGTLDTKSSRVLFQTLLCFTTKFAHIMWTYKLVGIQ